LALIVVAESLRALGVLAFQLSQAIVPALCVKIVGDAFHGGQRVFGVANTRKKLLLRCRNPLGVFLGHGGFRRHGGGKLIVRSSFLKQSFEKRWRESEIYVCRNKPWRQFN